METDRILRLTELLEITGHSRSGIYREIQAKRFPRPVAIGERSRGWRESEVQAWIRDLETVEIGPGGDEDGGWPQEPHG